MDIPFIIGSLVILGLTIALNIRNRKVYNFRIEALHKDSDWWQGEIHRGTSFTSHQWYDSLESYTMMVLKFWRPLKSFTKVSIEDFYEPMKLEELIKSIESKSGEGT